MFSLLEEANSENLFDRESAASLLGHLKTACWEKSHEAHNNKDYAGARNWERLAQSLHRSMCLADKLEL